jgi:DME family drug/metabolite transporter
VTPAGRGVVLVAAASVLFGTTGTALALAPESVTPLQAGAARLVIGGAALAAWLLLIRKAADGLAVLRRPAGLLLVAGICVYQPAFFLAAERSGVAVGALVALGTAPVWTGLLAATFEGFRPGRVWVGATGVAVVGLVLLTSAARTPDAWGVVAAATAGASYAVYTVAAARLLRDGVEPAVVMGAGFGAAGVVALPVLILAGTAWMGQPDGAAVALWLGLATTALAYVWFGRGLKVLPAPTVATLTLLEPVVATVLAVAVLNESVTALQVAGGLLLLTALAVLGREAASSSRQPAGAR